MERSGLPGQVRAVNAREDSSEPLNAQEIATVLGPDPQKVRRFQKLLADPEQKPLYE
jgi:hypothetical protein